MNQEILPNRLQRAAHEIAMMMELNGRKDWCFGPIASRAFLQRLETELRELREALEAITVVRGGRMQVAEIVSIAQNALYPSKQETRMPNDQEEPRCQAVASNGEGEVPTSASVSPATTHGSNPAAGEGAQLRREAR